MQEFLAQYYLWIKAFHVISVIAWMAGMLYLPRLFVYHADKDLGKRSSDMLKLMEKRLLKIIMNPAMMATWGFGILMLVAQPSLFEQPWMHMKLMCVLLMSGLHGMFAKLVKRFAADENTRDAKFYRILNEVPTGLMIIIVILAVAEPF